MSLLFAMPEWSSAGELWMQRMIEALASDIAYIAVEEPPEPFWRGRIPSLRIGDLPPRLWRRVAKRAGLPTGIGRRPTGARNLRRVLSMPQIRCTLFHYLSYALRFEEVWAEVDTPLYIHCHGADVTWDFRSHQAPQNPVNPPGYIERVRRFSGRARFIANSRVTAARLTDIGVPADRVAVIHLGVPVPSEPINRLNKSKEIEILYLGRLVDCKGPDLVIRAFELACESGFDGRLTIAGNGALRITCELLCKRSKFSDRISMLGEVDAGQGEMLRRRADIFTAHNCFGPLSHQEEAFGVSIVEAMAAALPVISGRSGSLSEVVEDGVTGILVESGDVEAQARAFVKLGSDPQLRRHIGEAGWHRARERFTSEMHRDRLRAVLGLAEHK